METVRSGARPFVDLDTLHAESLPDVLAQFGIADVSDAVRAELVQAWHRLDAWPEGARRPGAAARALHAGAELERPGAADGGPRPPQRPRLRRDPRRGYSRDYKPKPALYRDAVAAFGFAPEETMMVAAHSSDLAAAASHGLSTAHIARPSEHGPAGGETGPSVPVTYAASDLADLADQLGCR